MPGAFRKQAVLPERRGVTTFEYALVAAALALVLFEVMRAPAQAIGAVVGHLFGGAGSHPTAG
ncbi:MAG: hypothetical protein WDN04_04375 [Rhodospirillales bacterium]